MVNRLRSSSGTATLLLVCLVASRETHAFAPVFSNPKAFRSASYSSRTCLYSGTSTTSTSTSASDLGFRHSIISSNSDSKKKRDQRSRVTSAIVASEEYEARQALSAITSEAEAIVTAGLQERRLIFPDFTSSVLPVLSAAFLMTGNTVGAGCLVLPELAAGPGLGAVTAIFITAWLVNLISGLAIAEVAIQQKENTQDENALPASFKEFAETNLRSPAAGMAVAGISLFVNACVLAFDLSRAGILGEALTGLDAAWVAGGWATVVAALLTTQSTDKLSILSSVLVALLFASFGGLLLPGLAAIPDPLAVFAAPGTAPECYTCLAHLAPIILMSMVYQNVVPTVTKLLDYDRRKTVSAIILGSGIPLVMYVAWCLAGVGGGVDLSVTTAGPLLTLFSMVTLGGSSMGSSLSLAEELSAYFVSPPRHQESASPAEPSMTASQDSTSTKEPFRALPVLAAISLPLAAALAWGQQEGGLTGALSLAGSFGSPLLYGVLPAIMAVQQRRHREEQQQGQNQTAEQQQGTSQDFLLPGYSLPLLGGLSTAFVGQEMIERAGEFLAMAT